MAYVSLWGDFVASEEYTGNILDNKLSSALYDVHSIGTVSKNESSKFDEICGDENITVLSTHSNSKELILSVDSSLLIFQNSGVNHVTTKYLSNESKVDCVCFRHDGKQAVVADSSGTIHVVETKNGNTVYSQTLPFKASNRHSKLFCSVVCMQETDQDSYCIIIGTFGGKICIFRNINLDLLSEGHDLENEEVVNEVKKEMFVQQFDASIAHTGKMEQLCCFFNGLSISVLTVGKGNSIMALWEHSQNNDFEYNDRNPFELSCKLESDLVSYSTEILVKKCFVCESDIGCGDAYTLDTEGCMYQWVIDSGMVYMNRCLFSGKQVEDFTISDSYSTDSPRQLYTIEDMSELAIYSLPSMTKIFSTSLDSVSIAVFSSCSSSMDEEIITLGWGTSFGSGKFDQLSMKCISKASPEDRLIRLVHSGQLDKAIQFAADYNLDPQQIYEQKAAYLLNSLNTSYSSESKQINTEETFQELIATLKKIDSSMVVAEICAAAVLPDLNMTYDLLIMGRTRLEEYRLQKKNISNMNGQSDSSLLFEKLGDLLSRLVTYQLVFGRKSFQNNCSDVKEPGSWIHFRDASLPLELFRLISSGNLAGSAQILTRHKVELLKFFQQDAVESDTNLSEVNEDDICKKLEGLFNCIPHSIDIDILVAWLEDTLIPIMISKIPCSEKVLCSWLCEKAESLENCMSNEWPLNAFKLANSLFNVKNQFTANGFMNGTMDLYGSKSSEANERQDLLQSLRSLVSRLQQLIRLKQRYKCDITLQEITVETTMSLTYRMLDKVMVPELILQTLENIIRPYIKEQGLSEKDVLLGYIEDVLSRGRDKSWGSIGSVNERKVVAIIGSFSDPHVILNATSQLAKAASIPWSSNTSDLIEKSYKLFNESKKVAAGDPVQKELQQEKEMFIKTIKHHDQLAKLPAIQAEYGFQNELTECQPCSRSNHIQFIMFLVEQDNDSAFNQAVIYAATFSDMTKLDIYKFKLIYLTENQLLSKAVDILDRALNEDFNFGIELLNRVIKLCNCFLSNVNKIWKETRIQYLNSVIRLIEHFANLPNKNLASRDVLDDFNESLSRFKSILNLQINFNVILSFEEFMDTKFKDDCLQQQVIKTVENHAAPLPSSNLGSGDNIHTLTTTIAPDILDKSSMNTGVSLSNLDMLNYALLLGIPTKTLRSKLAETAALAGEASHAISLSLELIRISPSSETAMIVYKVILILLQNNCQIDKLSALFPSMMNLCALSMTLCEPSYLMKIAYLHGFISLCNNIFKVVNNNQSSFIIPRAVSTDRFSSLNWLHPFYEDKGAILLTPSQANALVYKLIQIIFDNGDMLQTLSKTNYSNLKDLQSLTQETIAMLQSTGRSQILLEWIIYCSATAITHLANSKELQGNVNSEVWQKIMEASKELNAIFPKIVEEFIGKILINKSPDIDYAVALLTVLPLQNATTLIKRKMELSSRNYKHMKTYATAGLNFLKLHKMETEILKFQDYFLNSHWGNLLNSLGIDFNSFMFSSRASKGNILPVIIRNPDVNGKIIKDFCQDYDLDVNNALLEFATVLLADSKFTILGSKSPLLPIQGNSNSNNQIAINSPLAQNFFLETFCSKGIQNPKEVEVDDETDGYCGRSWSLINSHLKFIAENVTDIYELCHGLMNIVQKNIHPYAYKRLRCILQTVERHYVSQYEEIVKKILDLLLYLESYERIKPLEHAERQWLSDKYGMTTSPELANVRLPIHPLIYGNLAWQILMPELNEESIQNLLPVAKLLGLDVDKVYMSTATNITNVFTNSSNAQIPKDKIRAIKQIANSIKDLQMATAIAKNVAELLATSQDKVDAYEWCIELATKWYKSLSQQDPTRKIISNMLVFFKQYLCNASTELILKNYNLETPSTLHLVGAPQKLIVTLYKHESIVERYYHPSKIYPDIHEAANKIARIHSDVDISKIRKVLQIEWLLSASEGDKSEDDDSTINLANKKVQLISGKDQNVTNEMKEDLIRLLYLLSHDKDEEAAKSLTTVIRKENSRITNAVKARGLFCLLQVFPDYIQKISSKNLKELRSNLQVLVFVSKLEAIGCSIQPAQFSSCDKSELAQSIVNSQELQKNPRALRTAAEICRVFGSWCPKAWYIILQQLVATQQVVYLHQLLREINWNPVICSLPCLPTVWQSCVTQPLVTMTPPLTKEETKTSLACYHFLFECPVLLQIDLREISQHFCSVEMHVLALGTLLCDPTKHQEAMNLATDYLITMNNQIKQLGFDTHPIAGQKLILDCMKSVQE